MFKNILLYSVFFSILAMHSHHFLSFFVSPQGKTSSLITDSPGQVGPPLQIHSTSCVPPPVCKAYCAEMVWVTTGEASHVKF